MNIIEFGTKARLYKGCVIQARALNVGSQAWCAQTTVRVPCSNGGFAAIPIFYYPLVYAVAQRAYEQAFARGERWIDACEEPGLQREQRSAIEIRESVARIVNEHRKIPLVVPLPQLLVGPSQFGSIANWDMPLFDSRRSNANNVFRAIRSVKAKWDLFDSFATCLPELRGGERARPAVG